MSKELQKVSNFLQDNKKIDKGCFATKLVKLSYKCTNNNIA